MKNRIGIKSIFLLIIPLFCSCNKQHPLIGKWKVGNFKSYSFWERNYALLKGVNRFIMGTELDINSDSTFNKNDCGNTSTGKWRIKDDSLVLLVDTTIQKNDKLKKLMANKPTKGKFVFLIGRNKLIHYEKGIFSNIERDSKDSSLKFVNPHEVYSIEILKPID